MRITDPHMIARLQAIPGAKVSPRAGVAIAAADRKARELAGETIRTNPKRRILRRPTDEYKSDAEASYAEFLRIREMDGEVLWWHYEPWEITLAKKTVYKPDFVVKLADGRTAMVEVKGSWTWEDARVKYKVAREMRPEFAWICIERKRGRWSLKMKNGQEPLILLPDAPVSPPAAGGEGG